LINELTRALTSNGWNQMFRNI